MVKKRTTKRNPPTKPKRQSYEISSEPDKSTEPDDNINNDKHYAGINNLKNTSYADATKSEVEDEVTTVEVITKWFTQWGPWIVIGGLVFAVLSAYLSFKNDLTNSQSSIDTLKKSTKNHDKAITDIEKNQIATDSNLEYVTLNYNAMKDDIRNIKTELKSVEIEQAKLLVSTPLNSKAATQKQP